jgi:N-methylhydantoinase B/oxoprolinase/acetone carboxylase alpha subunit
MAFDVAIGHIEIGGLGLGAFASEATEIFHEGLRILQSASGVVAKMSPTFGSYFWLRCELTSNYGDYRVLISAVDLGERELTAYWKYGKEVFTRTFWTSRIILKRGCEPN